MAGKSVEAPKMGLWAAVAVVIGNVIASGVFLLPSSLASYGTFALFGWIIAAVGTICIGLVFGFLSSRVVVLGGIHYYVKRMLGAFVGWQMAWVYWFFCWAGNITIAVAAVGYISYFIPMGFVTQNMVMIGFLWLFTFTTMAGLRTYSVFQVVTTIFKILPLVFIGIVGWFYVDPHNFIFSMRGQAPHSALFSVTLLALWAFVGVESAVVVGSRVKNPTKTVPLSIILGVVAIAVLYIASTTSIMGMLSPETLATSPAPYADAMEMILGKTGGLLVTALVLISCLGAINGWTLVTGDILAGGAKEGLFPKFLAREAKNSMPINALLVSALVETLYVFVAMISVSHKNIVAEYTLVAIAATMGGLLPYFYSSLAAIFEAILEGGRRSIKYIVVSVVALVFSLVLMLSNVQALYYGVVFLFVSTPLYLYTVRTSPPKPFINIKKS